MLLGSFGFSQLTLRNLQLGAFLGLRSSLGLQLGVALEGGALPSGVLQLHSRKAHLLL